VQPGPLLQHHCQLQVHQHHDDREHVDARLEVGERLSAGAAGGGGQAAQQAEHHDDAALQQRVGQPAAHCAQVEAGVLLACSVMKAREWVRACTAGRERASEQVLHAPSVLPQRSSLLCATAWQSTNCA
jgi:hypothetical protein